MIAHAFRRTSILPSLLALLVLTTSGAISAQSASSDGRAQVTTSVSDPSFRSSPVMFIENAGQWEPSAGSGQAPRFQVWGGTAGTMWLAEDAIWLTVVERPPVAGSQVDRLRGRDPATFNLQPADLQPTRAANIRLSFVDANPHPRIEPFDRLDTVVSYFIGNEPDQWRADVPVWGAVRYVDLYPGVDLQIMSEAGQVVQLLTARPGADLSAVQLRVEGADEVMVDDDALRLSTAAGEVAWPLTRADGLQVAGSKVQMRGTQVFDVTAPFTAANSSRLSVIEDPQSPADNPADLLYGTYLGGSGSDSGYSIAVDGAGNVYVTGGTASADFPTTPGAFDTSLNGNSDGFVVKLNLADSRLLYVTYLGGSSEDWGNAIAVDGNGAAYVTGVTVSTDFPTTAGAFDRSIGGGWDAFVAKLNAAGSGLTYATFLGGSDSNGSLAIALDGAGNAYVAGITWSSDFPTTTGAFDRIYNGGYGDGFAAKLNAAGSGLIYATFLGGSSFDRGVGIAVDGAGSAYVTGETESSDFPTTSGALDRSYNGGSDAFVVKLNPNGSTLAYSTFLGGSDADVGSRIAVDGTGNVFVTGGTQSSDFPTTVGALDRSYNGGDDGFVVKLHPGSSTLAYATFLGGSKDDQVTDITMNEAGNVYVTGGTLSSDFPTTSGALDRSYNGGSDAFVVKLNPNGSTLAYSTYLGGSDDDYGHEIAVDGSGATCVTGKIDSADFPTTPGAFDRSYNGGDDTFVVKLAMGGPVIPPTPTPTVTPTPTRTPTPIPLPDLSVDHIEVAQVFVEQNDPTSGTPIPLIAQKDTLVRVYVGVSGAASVGGVSARLHIRQPNGTETVDSRPVNVGSVQAKQTPDPFSLQDTVNFRPPTKLLQGNVTFWADVDPANRVPETNESNNTGGQISKTFVVGKPVRIAITQIGYRDSLFSAYSYADWNTIAHADSMLRQVYPVGANDVQYYYQPGHVDPVQCINDSHTAECWGRFHLSLQRFWHLVDDGAGWEKGTRPHALVGWVPGSARSPGATCGEAYQGFPHEAIVADYCDQNLGRPPALSPVPVERVLAHEVAHLLNYNHELMHAKNESNAVDPQCSKEAPTPDPQYPTSLLYPTGTIFAHGLDLQESNVLFPKRELPAHPAATYDLMTYCSPAWVSPYNYFKLNTGFVDPPNAQTSGAGATSGSPKLLVSGLVYSPTLQTELDPFYLLSSSAPPSASTGSAYCLELRGAGSVVLDKRCFDLTFTEPEPYEPTTVDGFALTVPHPSGTTQIVLTHLGNPIATRAVSQHAPTVRLLSPNGGETWAGTGTYPVTWTAGDLDGDSLHFALAYSTDGGASWIPAGLDLTGTQHALDVSMLPGATAVLLRISATDGVNTTDDVSDAPFRVDRKAPQAFILSPEDGAHFFPGTAIWLEGRAFDLEDGTLDDAALSWASNRDGELGTGKLLIATLSPGEHVITLTATDSDDAQTATTIRVSAGDRLFLPVVLQAR